jgi:hypothetical protein
MQPKDLTTTREYAAGVTAWRRQNFILPGFTFTWQVQAYNTGFNAARDAENKESTFTHIGTVVNNVLKRL